MISGFPHFFYGMIEPNTICFSSLDSWCKFSCPDVITKS